MSKCFDTEVTIGIISGNGGQGKVAFQKPARGKTNKRVKRPSNLLCE